MGRYIERADLLSELSTALQALGQRTHDRACVLIEDRLTEKFLQFGRGPTLVLDLPLNGLTTDEVVRARTAFAALGATASQSLESPDVNGEPITRTFEVLQADFGDDFGAAAKATIDVFDKVYQMDEVSFVLHEN